MPSSIPVPAGTLVLALSLGLGACRAASGSLDDRDLARALAPPPPAANAEAQLASVRTEETGSSLREELAIDPVPDPEDTWRHVITPYIWTMRVDGNGTISGNDVIIDDSFHDILDNLSFVVEGRYEAWKGNSGFLVDLTYARLESEVETGAVQVDTKTDLVLALAGWQRRFVDQQPEPDGSGGVKIDFIAAVGVTSMDANIDFKGGANVDGDESWFDPLVGLRSRWGFSHEWGGMIEALIGGFELLDGSDLFTMFSVVVGRRWGSGHLYFGWRNLDVDYNDGDDLAFDLRLSGPLVGYEWQL